MPSAEFSNSVAANLNYWLNNSQELDDKTLHRLDGERHNLHRAVGFGIKLPPTRCAAARLILQIYPLIERRGYWRRWIPLLEGAVTSCADADTSLTIDLLDRLGQCYRLNRQWPDSLASHQREEKLARQLADPLRLAKARLNLSQIYWSQRRYDQAVENGQAALTGFQEAGGSVEQLGATATILGLIAYGRGDLPTAEKWLAQAIAAYRTVDLPALLARSLMNLTLCLERDGRGQEALPLCREALDILDPTEHELDKVRVELAMGTIFLNSSRLEEAEAAYKRADSPALRRIGDSYLMALLANNLGNVYLEMGRLEDAERKLKGSIALWRTIDSRLFLANSLGSMAEVQLALNRPAAAQPFLEETIAITREYPDDGWARDLLAKYEKMSGELRVCE